MALSHAIEDGKYRPTEVTTRIIPTTTRLLTLPTTRPPCQWPYDRCDPYDRRTPNYDPRYDPRIDSRFDSRHHDRDRHDPRHNNRYPGYDHHYDSPRYDSHVPRNPWDRKVPARPFYDRPIRLEEKIEENGYSYKYETARGIIAEEKGIIENLAIRTAFTPVKVQGFVAIKEFGVEKFRMDYTVTSRDQEFVRHLPRGQDEQRIPPAMARAIELMETHA